MLVIGAAFGDYYPSDWYHCIPPVLAIGYKENDYCYNKQGNVKYGSYLRSTCDTNIQFKTLNITIFLILTILL